MAGIGEFQPVRTDTGNLQFSADINPMISAVPNKN